MDEDVLYIRPQAFLFRFYLVIGMERTLDLGSYARRLLNRLAGGEWRRLQKSRGFLFTLPSDNIKTIKTEKIENHPVMGITLVSY